MVLFYQEKILNKLRSKIVNFQQSKYFSVIELSTEIGNFSCVVAETPQTVSYLKVGESINMVFNNFDILILKDKDNNLINAFESEIVEIEKGNLLSKIYLKANENTFISFLLTKQLEILDLKVRDKVFCHLKPTNIFIEVEK